MVSRVENGRSVFSLPVAADETFASSPQSGWAWLCFLLPGRPREFRPEPPTDPDVNLSLHPARATLKKAAAFHQDKEFLRFPVDSIRTWVACPLRSTGITPASSLLRSSAPLTSASVFSASWVFHLCLSLGITGPVLKFRTKARIRVTPPVHRNTAWPVSR